MRAFIKKLEGSKSSRMYINDSFRYLNEMGKTWGMERPVDKITPQDVVNFRSKLIERNLSSSTLDRYMAAGRSAWNFSIKNLRNPFADVGLLNADNQVTRFLTDQQRIELIKACKEIDEKLFQMIVLTLATGLRKNNVLRLSRNEVDFEHGSISLITKGSKRHVLYPAPSVMEMLKSIPNNGTDFFWVNEKTREPYDITWRKQWHLAKQKAGISHEFRWHDLRHDAGTLAYLKTGDLKLVSDLLGHSNLAVTKRYAHTVRSHLQKGFNAIDPLSTYMSKDV